MNYSIMEAMPGYASRTFENISMEFLQAVAARGRLGGRFTRWGRWWDRENEIDIVALDTDTRDILFCECKWQNRKVGVDVISRMLDKVPLVKWFNGARNEYYAVYPPLQNSLQISTHLVSIQIYCSYMC